MNHNSNTNANYQFDFGFSRVAEEYRKKEETKSITEAETKRWESLNAEQKSAEIEYKKKCTEYQQQRKFVEERQQKWSEQLNSWSHIRCSPIWPRSSRQQIELHLASSIGKDFSPELKETIAKDLECIYAKPQCGLPSQFDKIRGFLSKHL
jgi:hypothetical protein